MAGSLSGTFSLENVEHDDSDDEQKHRNSDTGQGAPAGQRQCKDQERNEEEDDDDVGRRKPPVLVGRLAEVASTGDGQLPHVRDRVPDENARDVEEEMGQGNLQRQSEKGC